MRYRSRWIAGLGSGLLLYSFLIGCGSSDKAWPKRYPVSGKVLVDGKPAVRAAVVFHPLSPQPDGKIYQPSTFTGDDGSFRLTTFAANDGAPPEEYTVTIEAKYVVVDGQDVVVPDQLKGRYTDAQSSPLKVTVREEDNLLAPFDLKFH